MNQDNALNLIPDEKTIFSMTALEKKILAENVIKEIISQIEAESRNPTEWEKEALSYSFGLILSGFYIAAIKEALFCFSGKDEVDRPEHWWKESENLTIHDLKTSLAYISGAPLRGI